METTQPEISVVIPVYNDPDGVRVTLESVLDQTYSDVEYEVIAVDNNSNDGTQSVIRTFCEQFPSKVRLAIENEIQGQSAALTKGIEQARGSMIAFIDADMTVEKTWLESITTAMDENKWDVMGCKVEIYSDSDRENLVEKYDMAFGFQMERYIKESNFTGSGCLVVRQSVIEEVGPFDVDLDFSFDREFGMRVHEAGYEHHYNPEIPMYHPARSSFRGLIEKSIRTGRGKSHLHTRFPERFETRSFLDPRKYLPPHPIRFHARLTESGSFSKREILCIYLISYLSKLFRAVGEIYERITGANETLSTKHR